MIFHLIHSPDTTACPYHFAVSEFETTGRCYMRLLENGTRKEVAYPIETIHNNLAAATKVADKFFNKVADEGLPK